MRALALTSLLSLAGCVAYTQAEPAYAPPPPPSQPPPAPGQPPPGPGAAPGAATQAPPRPGALSEQQAVEAAFRLARERGLVVDRVRSARRDGQGRWRIELHGEYDRARLLLDPHDGRLLRGKFRARDGRPGL